MLKILNNMLESRYKDYYSLWTPNKPTYIGERIKVGGMVRFSIANIARTDGGSEFECFIINQPQISTFKQCKVNETVYTCIIDHKLAKYFSENEYKFALFLDDFSIKTKLDFDNLVKDSEFLVGTTYPTLTAPGYEGEYIRLMEDGNYQIRLYTDLTPYKE